VSKYLTRDQIILLRGPMIVEGDSIPEKDTKNLFRVAQSHLAALDAAQEREEMWKDIVNDFLITMIDMALDDDADSRERRRKQAYSRMEIALGRR